MLASLNCVFRLLKGVWHCQRVLFWVKIFVITICKFITLFFHVIFGWLSLLFLPLPHLPSPPPLLFMVTLGEEKVFCCSLDFLTPVMNGMSSFGSKFFYITRLVCFVGLFFSSELMHAIDLWRLYHINEIVFLNFLFSVSQIAESSMETKVYDIFKKKYLWQIFLKLMIFDSLLT